MSGVFAHWPNRITAIRFLGSFGLFGLFTVQADVRPETTWFFQLAFVVFSLVAATDALDGWLARRGNHVSAFGRIADPFVDKVLVLGTMIFLAVMDWSRGWFPAWIVVVVLAREFLVTGIRGYVESLGKEFPADWFGKIKMIVQCCAIGSAFAVHAGAWPEWLASGLDGLTHVLVWATLISATGSGLSYLLRARTLLAEEAP